MKIGGHAQGTCYMLLKPARSISIKIIADQHIGKYRNNHNYSYERSYRKKLNK